LKGDIDFSDKPLDAQKQLEKYMMDEINKFIEEELVPKITADINDIYDTYKPMLDSATLIDAAPKDGEPGFIKTKVETKFETEYIQKEHTLNINLSTPDKATQLTLEAGNIGTGIGINPLILRKFKVEPEKLPNGLSRWFMKPRYHLDNFLHDIKKLAEKVHG